MNIKILQKRMGNFFKETSIDDLVKIIENLGYEVESMDDVAVSKDVYMCTKDVYMCCVDSDGHPNCLIDSRDDTTQICECAIASRYKYTDKIQCEYWKKINS